MTQKKSNRKAKPKAAENYTVVLTILGKEYKQTGKTIKSALDKFKLDSAQLKGRGVLKVIKGDEVHERLMNMSQLKRTFNSNLARFVFAKNLSVII